MAETVMTRNIPWTFLVSRGAGAMEPEALDGAWNMAIDHALFEHAQQTGRPALRFYRWDPATLSLGRNQPAHVDADALQSRGYGLVRRPTGGMAVLHDHELTYSVAVPVGVLGSPRESYQQINVALLEGLRSLGAGAQVATDGAATKRIASCFAEPAAGELLVDARKLVGSAQRCESRTLLQHGSILIDGDQTEIATLIAGSAGGEPAIGLAQVLGRAPGWSELVGALAMGFVSRLGISLAPAGLTPELLGRAKELRRQYLSHEWTWRLR